MQHLPIHHVPGPPDEAGYAHGCVIRDLFEPDFVDAYFDRLADVIHFTNDDLRVQARRWFDSLPEHYREEMAGMADGARVATETVCEFLYADIARATPQDDTTDTGTPPGDQANTPPSGPMCSALIARLNDDALWIGRNCDWLTPTLMRGTAAVVHETPHRIPVMAIGIRGDIDVDTGMNAEQLWLHLHTLFALDDPPADRTCISWLFWAREALETCASLDELERFIENTGRDRGVLAIAGDGKTNEAAVFECSHAAHERYDIDPSNVTCATNHSLARAFDEPALNQRNTSGTVSRYRNLRARARTEPPKRGPDDLMMLLASDGVEMRTPRWMRTIYSAVVQPAHSAIWFASGDAEGRPAASSGRWARIAPPWAG